MTYIARAELAAAVSEAGGLGMIETLTPEGRADLLRVRGLHRQARRGQPDDPGLEEGSLDR